MAKERKKTLLQQLDDMVGTRRMTQFVIWYCTPEDERESFEEFASKNDNKNVPWDYAKKNWLLDEDIQRAIKFYMKLQHAEKMKKIYDKMYEQALNGDVQSAKYLIDFSKDFFASDKENELDKLLSGIDIDENEEEE